MSDNNCGNCLHWQLWPRDNTQRQIRLCLAPLPEWAYAGGDQSTTATDGKQCDAWEAKR